MWGKSGRIGLKIVLENADGGGSWWFKFRPYLIKTETTRTTQNNLHDSFTKQERDRVCSVPIMGFEI